MKVKITYKDIRQAKACREKFNKRETWIYDRQASCPLAFALRRVLSCRTVRVSSIRLYVEDRVDIEHTEDVRKFVDEADRKKDRVRPCTLDIPGLENCK